MIIILIIRNDVLKTIVGAICHFEWIAVRFGYGRRTCVKCEWKTMVRQIALWNPNVLHRETNVLNNNLITIWSRWRENLNERTHGVASAAINWIRNDVVDSGVGKWIYDQSSSNSANCAANGSHSLLGQSSRLADWGVEDECCAIKYIRKSQDLTFFFNVFESDRHW